MSKSRLFLNFLIVGSTFMILLIIFHWDNVGAAYFYLHTPIMGPHASHDPPGYRSMATHKAVGSEGSSFQPDTDAFLNQSFKGTSEPLQKTRDGKTFGNDAGKPEDRYISEERKKRQDDRKQLVRDLCAANSTLDFPGKRRTFDDIPSTELDHLIVDDHHRVIYCYVPKAACSHWKGIMIMLSGSVLKNGKPYRDLEALSRADIHSVSSHLIISKFSRHMMKARLQNYTKFLFVRDPFVRLISAHRDKFEKPNQLFYRSISTDILKRYGNYSNPPASVDDAFKSGIRPSFSHFVQYLLDPETEKKNPFNEHWQQIYRLCHPCQIDYDFIGKLETVNEDAEHLLHNLHLDDFIHFPPGYENKTMNSRLQDWFSSIPYESVRKLYKLYEPDFKLFGYPKPEKLLHDS